MRISTQAAAQSAILDLMRAQREAFDARQQLTDGKKYPDLKGFGNTSETILNGRAAQLRTESFIASNDRLTSRLQIQDLAYESLSDTIKDLRTAITTADGTQLMNKVQEAFDQAVSALNTQFNGTYVFGGVRTDEAPFSGQTIADLQAAAPIADLFENADRTQTAKLDDNTTVEVNTTAEAVGLELMEIIERIADFNAGPNGPFDGQTTDAQQAFLQTEITNLINAFDTVNLAQAENGSRQAQVESMVTSQEKQRDYMIIMVADLEDADMAEASVRFQQAQTAVQVSAQTFSTLSQVSLLNFL